MKEIIKKLILATWGLTLVIFASSIQAQILEGKPIRIQQVEIEELKAIEPIEFEAKAPLNFQAISPLKFVAIAPIKFEAISSLKFESIAPLDFIDEFDLNDVETTIQFTRELIESHLDG